MYIFTYDKKGLRSQRQHKMTLKRMDKIKANFERLNCWYINHSL